MRSAAIYRIGAAALCGLLLLTGCTAPPVKKLYMLNYEPDPMSKRLNSSPYAYTVRIKDFDIEKAYDRSQITYRQSPFELRYYYYHVWAVKPTDMITDLVYKHIVSSGLVSHTIRRLDEGLEKPDFELSGTIEAIEEYDSDDVWFAHLAIRLKFVRLRDNRTLYLRRFDKRKQVHQRDPEFVVRDLSQLMDLIMTQALHDIDVVLAREYGIQTGTPASSSPATMQESESRGEE
jgi:ABC-type uncharacterized transport system auxiliary subunit